MIPLDNGVLKLRTMTIKSVFDGGKYKDHSVSQCIALHKESFLRFSYYNYDRVSFTDDVLNIIGIPEGYRISKPGKSEEMFNKNKTYLYELKGIELSKLTDKEKMIKRVIVKNVRKRRGVSFIVRSDIRARVTKGQLQAKNHGK